MRLFEILRIPVDDYGTKGTLVSHGVPKNAKPLPGGTGLTYGVSQNGAIKEILIFDQDKLVGELDLKTLGTPNPMYSVAGISVDPDYRSKGIGMSLYGVALAILKLTLKAGDTQTVNGQRMWLKLNQIPGVEVQGITRTPANQFIEGPGIQELWRNKQNVVHTFPVASGVKSMKSARQGTGLYNNPNSSMIARWTGK